MGSYAQGHKDVASGLRDLYWSGYFVTEGRSAEVDFTVAYVRFIKIKATSSVLRHQSDSKMIFVECLSTEDESENTARMPFGNLAGLFLVVLGLGLWIIGYRMTDMEQEYDGIGFDKLREYVRKIGHEEVLYRWLHDAKERTKIEMLTYAYLRRHFISARMKELASKDFNEKALRNILNRKGEAIRKQSNAIRRQLSHKHDAVGGVQQPRNDKVPVSLSSLSSAQGLGFSEAREPIRPVGCSSTRDNDNLHTRDVDN